VTASGGRWWRTVRADLASTARIKGVPYPSARGLADILLLPGTLAVMLFRVSSGLHRAGFRTGPRLLTTANTILFGCDLDPVAVVGDGLVMPHPHGVAFGAVYVGAEARLMANVRLGGPGPSGTVTGVPRVGNECWLFDGAKVVGGVTVGDRSVISADTVVVRDVPADAVVAGNPGRVIRFRDRHPLGTRKELTSESA
jgi:serine O-acetyltransferase